jgi:CubicO group peptidase (beta-lactamase class C family)
MPLRPERMTRFGLRTLVYHETVPGHHFQIALATENPDLPRFIQIRAFGGISAITEGWALYAEHLAAEAGWYEDDVEGRIGQLDSALSPGCAVGVVESGELTFARGYGMANLEHGIAIRPTSIFRIASVSKQFAAATMLVLEREGALSLDDDVRRFLPELPDYGAPITIRHLIHHTSGLRDYLTLMSLAGRGEQDVYTNEDVVEMLARQRELNFGPGEEFLYSNSGYFLLSQVVLRATGRTLRQYAQERLLDPLGMYRTHFHDDPTGLVERRATGYAPRAEGGYRVHMTMLPMVGDGGIFTNIEEMALWERVFVGPPERAGDPALAAYLRARMPARGVLTHGDTIGYAFGLIHGTHRGIATVGHGGSFAGYRAHVLRAPAAGMSVTVLCNLAGAQPGRLAAEVLEVYLDDRMAPREPDDDPADGPTREAERPLALSAEELQPFAGSYHSEELDVVYELEVEDGRLVLARPASLAGDLEPREADRFAAPRFTLRFLRDDAGRVSGFLLDAGRVRNLRFSRTADSHGVPVSGVPYRRCLHLEHLLSSTRAVQGCCEAPRSPRR